MGVGSVDQPDMQCQRSAFDELLEKGRGHICRHPAETRAREVDVRHEQCLVARLEGDVRERLGGRHNRRAVAAETLGAQRPRQRLAERATGGTHLFLGVSRRDLQRDVERGVVGQQAEEMVEHGHAGGDVRGAVTADRHPHCRARVVGPISRGHSPASVAHSLIDAAKRTSVDEGMSRVRVSLTCVVVALCATASAPASPQREDVSVGYTTPAALRAAVRAQHATVLDTIPSLRIAHVRLAAGSASRLSALPGIRFVQRLTQRTNAAEPGLQAPAGKTSAWEWQFNAVHEDAVPDWVLRAASSTTIAVIDTGADVTAPDIAAKNPVVVSPRTGMTDVRDTIGHGTFVAALAAGSVTNGEGIAGFGGDAKLMIIKAGTGDGSFSDVDEAAAIAYAVDHGARIINLSFGGTKTTATERNAIAYAARHGVLVVTAAGNHYANGNPALYPAALVQPLGSKGVGGSGLAVGASTESGTRAPFSNTGSYLSLVAPGHDVFSAVSSTSPPASFPRVALPGSLRGLYGYSSGTSFAVPEVAGAAALVMAANPLLAATDVARVIKQSASGDGEWTPELGFGVLDVARAVEVATGATPEIAPAGLKLAARVVKRRLRLTARLSTPLLEVSTAERLVTFDRYNAARDKWTRVATVPTQSDGRARLTLAAAKKTLRFRARWSGAIDLAPASSKAVTIRPLS